MRLSIRIPKRRLKRYPRRNAKETALWIIQPNPLLLFDGVPHLDVTRLPLIMSRIGFLKVLHLYAKKLNEVMRNVGGNSIVKLTATAQPLAAFLNAHHHQTKYMPSSICRLLDQSSSLSRKQHPSLPEDVRPHENSLRPRGNRAYWLEVGLYRI